jgi:alcohol oxidase
MLLLMHPVTMYNRAVASDFDDWEQVHKNPGWGAKDIIPLLKKVSPM